MCGSDQANRWLESVREHNDDFKKVAEIDMMTVSLVPDTTNPLAGWVVGEDIEEDEDQEISAEAVADIRDAFMSELDSADIQTLTTMANQNESELIRNIGKAFLRERYEQAKGE